MRLRLLLPSLAVIVITTMVPAGLRHPSLHSIAASFDGIDFLNNILLYLPFGIALAGSSLGRATAYGFCLATLAECLQIGYVDRIPSPIDVLSNTMGTIAGYLLARAVKRRHHDPASIPVPRWLAGIAMVIGLAGAVGLVYHPPRSDFSNWVPDARLTTGPWSGHVTGLRIYPYTMTNVQIANLHCADPNSMPAGGFSVASDQTALYDSLKQQNRLTLVSCLEGFDPLPHMRRMVTLERDRERNFTLAQIDHTVVFLVRTPASGPSGWASAVQSGPVLSDQRTVLAIAVFDGSVSRLFIDGQLVAHANLGERRPHLPGRVVGWLPKPLPVREIELGAAEALLAGLLAIGLFGTIGIPHHKWLRATLGIVAGVVIGSIVWVFGVSAPHLGMRIMAESMVAGLTIAASATPDSVSAVHGT